MEKERKQNNRVTHTNFEAKVYEMRIPIQFFFFYPNPKGREKNQQPTTNNSSLIPWFE
jgi:hypothetical protein